MQGMNSLEGRVEICLSNTWGSVCDSGWGRTEAKVVCRQLGFSSAGNETSYRVCRLSVNCYVVFMCTLGAIPTYSASYGEGTGPIGLGTVECVGNETRLIECSSGATSGCTHSDDAGTICQMHAGESTCMIHLHCFKKEVGNDFF